MTNAPFKEEKYVRVKQFASQIVDPNSKFTILNTALFFFTLVTGLFSSSELDLSRRDFFTGTLGASLVRLTGLVLALVGAKSSSLSDESSTNSLDFGVVRPSL